MLPVAEEYKKLLIVEPAVADSITGDKWNRLHFPHRALLLAGRDLERGGDRQEGRGDRHARAGLRVRPRRREAFKEALAGTGAEIVHEEYAPQATTDFTAPAERLFNALKDKKGRKIIFIIWAGGNPFRIADLKPERYGIEIASGGNILPALAAYKALPGMEGATYYYYEIPQKPDQQVAGRRALQALQGAARFSFTAGGMSAGIAAVEALKKAGGTDSEKLIAAMEGLSFETPKGKMTFRKEDHQAMQSMFHFKVRVDPGIDWAVLTPVREIKPEEMKVPIRNKR